MVLGKSSQYKYVTWNEMNDLTGSFSFLFYIYLFFSPGYFPVLSKVTHVTDRNPIESKMEKTEQVTNDI